MAFIGTILQEVVKQKSAKRKKKLIDPYKVQEKSLKKLLNKAKNTEFGKDYNFSDILSSGNIINEFQKRVPVYNYESLFEKYWHKTINGVADVTWPGKIKFFALTSGTSESASKRIPVSNEMVQSIRRTSISQTYSLSNYNLPPSFFQKSALMLGGSTTLTKVGKRYEGDLSGIMTGRLPIWFQNFYKPGAKISAVRDWPTKLEKTVAKAGKWDIGLCAGVPAWYQILFEKIIKHYNVETIHDVWPNLKFYVHGGVSFEPYKNSFEKLLGEKIHFLETYLASEGFLAAQFEEEKKMQLVLDKGLFFEFIPFNEKNFNQDGQVVENPEVIDLRNVEEGVEYAILISTCAGAWRYVIGDTVKIIDKRDFQMIITGRTRHYLSLVGEHLSVDNMTKAVRMTADDLNININEFTVAGIPDGSLFAHKWFLGVDDDKVSSVDPAVVRNKIDNYLVDLNDDYGVERKAALREVYVNIVPVSRFYEWLKLKGKEGAQNKFPRVIKKDILSDWENFLESKK